MRWLVRLGLLIFWSAVSIGALGLSVSYHVDRPQGREAVRQVIGELVSQQIRGRFAIGRIEKLSLNRVVLSGVSLRDPQGQQVAVLEVAVVQLKLWKLAFGLLHMPSIKATGGTFTLIDGPDDEPTLFNSFRPARPSVMEGGPGIRARVDSIWLTRSMIKGQFLGLEGLVARNVRAHGHIYAQGDLRITLSDAQFEVIEPFPFDAQVSKISGTVVTNLERGGVHLHYEAKSGKERVQGEVAYVRSTPDTLPELTLNMRGSRISADTLRGAGFEWAEPFAAASSGSVELKGPRNKLRLHADLRTSAGAAEINGSFDDLGSRVTVTSNSLQIGKLFRTGPDITLGGKAYVQAAAEAAEGQDPTVEITSEPFTWNGVELPAAKGTLVLKPSKMYVRNLHSLEDGIRISASGSATTDGLISLAWQANVPRISKQVTLSSLLPSASGSLEGSGTLLLNTPTERLRIRGKTRIKQPRLDQLRGETLEVKGEISGAWLAPALDLKVEGSQMRYANYRIGKAKLDLRGGPRTFLLSGSYDADNSTSLQFAASATRSADGYTLQSNNLVYTRGEDAWRGEVSNLRISRDLDIQVGRVVLAHGAERLEAHGSVEKDRLHLTAEVQHFDLRALQSIAAAPELNADGRLDAHLEVTGARRSPDITFSGAAQEVRWRNLSGAMLSYFVNYSGGDLRVDATVTAPEAGAISATGVASLPQVDEPLLQRLKDATFEGTIDTQRLDLKTLSGTGLVPPGLPEGLLTAQVGWAGQGRDPTVSATFQVERFALEGVRGLDLRGDVSYNRSHLGFRELQLLDQQGVLISIDADYYADARQLLAEPQRALWQLSNERWNLKATVPPRSTSSLPAMLDGLVPRELMVRGTLDVSRSHSQLGGSLNASVKWLREPESSSCAAAHRPQFDLSATLNSGIAHVRLIGRDRDRPLVVLEATGYTPISTWLEQGSLQTPPTFDVTGSIRDARVQEMPWLCRFGQGNITMDLEASDVLGAEPSLSLTAKSPALRLSYISNTQRTTLSHPFQVHGLLKTTRESTADLSVLMTPARTGQRRSRCGQPLEQERGSRSMICGSLTGTWQHSGCLHAAVPIAWEQAQALPALQGSGRTLIEVKLREALLEPLLAYVPWIVEGDGLATGYARIEASGDRTRLSGSVSVKDGCLQAVGVGAHLYALQGRAVLRNRSLIFDPSYPLSARDESGTVSLHGPMRFEGLTPSGLDFQIDADSFPIRSEGTPLASLTGSARLRAKLEEDRTDATLDLQKLYVKLPDDTKRDLQPLEHHADVHVHGAATASAQDSAYPYNLSIDLSRPVTVRRQDFSVEVAGDLSSTYRAPKLRVNGYIQMLRGYFEIFGKKLDILRGSLNFDAEGEINPTVDLYATYSPRGQQADYISVTVSGRLQNPRIEFASSNPSITDRAEIIALLISGRRTGTRLSQADERAADQQASSFLAGLTAGLLTVGARREFGDLIPTIAIESGQSGFGGGKIRAGWQLDSVIQDHLRFLGDVVQGAYVEGFASSNSGAGTGTQAGTAGQVQQNVVGGLIELYFPNSFVGSMIFSPPDNWGVDVTWEP